MNALVCGPMIIDDVVLPSTKLRGVVGGSTTYGSLASSIFSNTAVSSVVGKDFPKKYLKMMEKRGIDLSILQRSKKKSFRWVARYSDDLSTITTYLNELNAFEDYDAANLKNLKRDVFAAFVTNNDPEIQLKILSELPKKTIKIVDSMDLWMIEKRQAFKKVIQKADVYIVSEKESKYLVDGNPAVPTLIEQVMHWGPKIVIYKRGEHGLTMYGKTGTMIVPSYPLVFAIDPTGAGDALGGSIAGVLARLGSFNEQCMRSAVLLGSTVASFVVEDYATESLVDLTLDKVINRSTIFLRQLPAQGDIPDDLLKM